MRVLLYIFGFWGGFVVGTIVGMVLFGTKTDAMPFFALLGSGVGVWLVKRTKEEEPRSQTVDPQPQTSYTDNRTIDNRRVFHIVANDKEQATHIIQELENEKEPEAIDMDEVRRKLIEKK